VISENTVGKITSQDNAPYEKVFDLWHRKNREDEAISA
jgi:hypothetical protein